MKINALFLPQLFIFG